jgi:F-type H+-transporting ATPase subunit gamma
MLGRLLRNGAPVLPQRLAGGNAAQTRNAASLKTVKERMRTVANIQKITKAMKMVAAAKMRGDQRRMELGMPFVAPVMNLFQRLPQGEQSGSVTLLAVTSDKGLCGGVNSAVNKATRLAIFDEEAKGNQVKVTGVGGKMEAGLKRLFSDRFTLTFGEIAKLPWNFGTASIIADRISATNPHRFKIIHNEFKNMAAYETASVHALTKEGAKSMDRQEWSKAMDVYTFEPSIYEVWDDLHEFYYGAAIFGAQLQSAVTEQSQRMAAMENASKNAGEMLDKLTLIYNRARQAKITTELCEIISGASAL